MTWAVAVEPAAVAVEGSVTWTGKAWTGAWVVACPGASAVSAVGVLVGCEAAGLASCLHKTEDKVKVNLQSQII